MSLLTWLTSHFVDIIIIGLIIYGLYRLYVWWKNKDKPKQEKETQGSNEVIIKPKPKPDNSNSSQVELTMEEAVTAIP